MGRERKGKKRAGRRSTSRIKKLINKEEEFSRRPALEPPFGLHPLRRSTVSRTLRVSANVPADTCCSVAPSAPNVERRNRETRAGGGKGTGEEIGGTRSIASSPATNLDYLSAPIPRILKERELKFGQRTEEKEIKRKEEEEEEGSENGTRSSSFRSIVRNLETV